MNYFILGEKTVLRGQEGYLEFFRPSDKQWVRCETLTYEALKARCGEPESNVEMVHPDDERIDALMGEQR
jgi:hypothetical protein